jgi:hypothetical protein
MKNANVAILSAVFTIVAASLLITTGTVYTEKHAVVKANPNLDILKTQIADLKDVIDAHKRTVPQDTFESLTYSHHEWSYFPEKHAGNIKVTWPDGSQTIGTQKRQEALKLMFAHAPDTRIVEDPGQHGIHNRTGVSGVLTGTFTEPLITGKGKEIKPTGQTFSVPIYAVGIWENGVMVEEYLYWDEEYHNSQLGVNHNSYDLFEQVKGHSEPSPETQIGS